MRTFKEWRGNNGSAQFPAAGVYVSSGSLNEDEEYEDGDILHFWYLCNQSSPAVKKFIVGLNDFMDECFPNEHKFVDTVESELSPLIHRYILVRHGDKQ